MFGAAFLDKASERKAVEKHPRLRGGEIFAVIRIAPTPDGTEEAAYRSGIVMRRRRGAQPWGAPSAGDLVPCHPVDEEDDVPRLLMDQLFEDLEHRLGQKAGPARDLEHAEPEKRIKALAVAEIGKRAQRIAARHIGLALLCG